MAKHLIYKQKVTLHLTNKDDAYALQDRVSKLLKNGLMDSMEAVLDNAFLPGKVVRIDKLQLDLGTVSLQNFEPEFKAQFIAALTKSLAEKKDNLPATTGNGAILTQAQSVENALIFFLEKGYLPWYSSANTKAGWEAEILNSFSETEYRDFFKWLQNSARQKPGVIDRIISQFSDSFIGGLLTKATSFFDESWELIFKDYLVITAALNQTAPGLAGNIETIGINGVPGNDTYRLAIGKLTARDKIWKIIFLILLDEVSDNRAFRMLKTLFSYSGIKGSDINPDKEKSIRYVIKSKTVMQAFKTLAAQLRLETVKHSGAKNSRPGKQAIMDEPNNALNNESASIDREDNDITRKIEKRTGPVTADSKSESLKANGNLNDDAKKRMADKEKDTVDNTSGEIRTTKEIAKTKKGSNLNEGDIISAANSGIVMLHPFLKPYFEGLELMNTGKFIDDGKRARAVLLLHYIATGAAEAAEFDLTLQKILCGYLLEDTLPAEIILSEKEQTETDNLLRAVLSHWEPLKNTSIDGFRGTFLQRAGSLELKDSGWLLNVEQKTIDILLGKLPWGFSTIRLPWMQEMISVDWY